VRNSSLSPLCLEDTGAHARLGDDNTTIRVGYDGGYENHEFNASLTVRL